MGSARLQPQPAEEALRAGMVLTPRLGGLEIALPDAQATIAGPGFLGPVAAGGEGEALGDHDRGEVAAGDGADSEEPAVLVLILRAAIDGASGKQVGQPVARGTAAGPFTAVFVGAGLGQFGGIEAEQADAIIAQAKAVAIAGATGPRNGRRRLVESGGDNRQAGQNHDGKDRAAATGKWSVSITLSPQDFTTR